MAREVLIEEQHPIPQQISAFQFHLVGDMTLKQFFQVAGGALVALLLYASGLPAFIKWPLIFISFGIGAALAFLPLEDRPLGKWVILFFKSIYSPTVFAWKHATTPPLFFQAEAAVTPTPTPPGAPKVPPEPSPAEKADQTPQEKKLEEKEKSFLSRITQAMHIPHAAIPTKPSKPATAVATGVAPVLPTMPKRAKPKSVPKIKHPPKEKPLQAKKPHLQPKSDAVPIEVSIAMEKEKPAETVVPKSVEPKKEVSIPKMGVVTVEAEKIEDKKPSEKIEVPAKPIETTEVKPIFIKTDKVEGKQAQFSQEAAPPIPPTQPNVIVGQVVDVDGKIIEGAILEIQDELGRPARAFKTNKLGHFRIVTPLLDGKYTILTEKDGFEFDAISFEAKGEIMQPIAIWAKKKVPLKEQPSVDETQIYNF